MPGLVGDQPEHRGRIGAGQQFGADVAGGFDPRLSGLGLFVQPGVVDRDARGRGERLDEYLVVLAERLPARLLGQIQVAEHLVADPYRHSEECPHRRMVRRKADRRGVVGDVVQPNRLGIVDQHPEHAAPLRQVPDLLAQSPRRCPRR